MLCELPVPVSQFSAYNWCQVWGTAARMVVPEDVKKELEALRWANRVLAESKAQGDRESARLTTKLEALRIQHPHLLAVSLAPVKKDLSLQSLVKPWSGSSQEPSVDKFVQSL